MAKSRDTLLEELNASVRSAGQGGLTTAQDLRNFLTTLIDELLDRPVPEADPDSPAYLFQVDLGTGEPGPLVSMTMTQARSLAKKGEPVYLPFDNPNLGNEQKVAISYDPSTGEFVSDGVSEETGDQYQVYLVGHGPLANPSTPSKGEDSDLVFVFRPNREDEMTRAIEPKQAGFYDRAKLENIENVRYFINEEETKPPFDLQEGDKLRVSIKRIDYEQQSSVQLLRKG